MTKQEAKKFKKYFLKTYKWRNKAIKIHKVRVFKFRDFPADYCVDIYLSFFSKKYGQSLIKRYTYISNNNTPSRAMSIDFYRWMLFGR